MNSEQAQVILILNVDKAGPTMSKDVREALILAIIALHNQPDLTVIGHDLVIPRREPN